METARAVKDVSPHEFVKAYAAHLKRNGKMEVPHWTDIVKTGNFKELAAYDPDWCYIRAAARKIHLRGGIGVGAFRRIYGGRKRNGSAPPHFCKSSGGVARHILQQLQSRQIVDFDGWAKNHIQWTDLGISTRLPEELWLLLELSFNSSMSYAYMYNRHL